MAETENTYLYLVGTAGSGKSRLTGALKRWMHEHSLDAIAVNLDPGAERLPYDADVDVREWIRLGEVMEEHGLGPNGAQVVAADLLALQAEEILEAIEGFRTDVVLLDTPGQTELFVFREAGKHMVERFAPDRTAVAFLLDPFLARNAPAFVSQAMLAATAQFRFRAPMATLLSKADMLAPEEVERIVGWLENPDSLRDALDAAEPGMYTQLNASLLRVLEDLGTLSALLPVSSETFDGLDDVYSFVQGAFAGAEDAAAR